MRANQKRFPAARTFIAQNACETSLRAGSMRAILQIYDRGYVPHAALAYALRRAMT